jgi:carbamoyl-phosphate synthase large subunit
MVDLATKALLGKKLQGMGYGTGLYQESKYVAVKVPVFSFEKLHDVDTTLGPEMKSTGEVLGISKDLSEALYKGLLAANLKIKEKGGILMTVRDSDKQELIEIAKEFEKLGYDLYATGKTALKLNSNFIATNSIKKIGEGKPDLLDLIQSGKINLIINTPTKGRSPERDGFKIRRKAVEQSIPCLTSLDTAKALITTLKLNKEENDLELVDITKI